MSIVSSDQLRFIDLPGRRAADPLRGADTTASMRIVRLERQPSRLAHRHPASEEIIHVRSGRGVIYVDGGRTTVAPGDTVHIPTGAAHATVPDPGEEMELICFFPHPRLEENYEETTLDVMTEGV